MLLIYIETDIDYNQDMYSGHTLEPDVDKSNSTKASGAGPTDAHEADGVVRSGHHGVDVSDTESINNSVELGASGSMATSTEPVLSDSEPTLVELGLHDILEESTGIN